jgi:PST family polysaccharide transporter
VVAIMAAVTSSPDTSAPAGVASDSWDATFCTKHLVGNMGRRAARAAAVTITSQGLRFLLQIGSTAVLARVLTPRDFGLVGMVAVVTGLVGLIKDFGLSAATVQRAELRHEQVSTLFWINVALSACLMAALAAVAPVVAWLYGEPLLTPITLALAGTFLLSGLTAQHHALLRRQMRFTELATAELGGVALGMTVSIAAAVWGASYWALVIGVAVNAASTMVLVWIFSGWRPGRPHLGCGVRSMLAFGGSLTAYDALSYLAVNADQMLIGWYWGAGPLGIYSKAYALVMLPMQQIRTPISQVAVPALCRLRDDPGQFRSFYLKTLSLIALVTLPIGAAAALGTDEVILLLLGRQWTAAGAVFRALAFAMPLQAVLGCVGWLFVSTGRAKAMLKWGAFSCSAIILSFVVGLPFGPVGVAASYSIMNVLVAWPVSALGVRGTPITTADFWGTMPKPLIGTLAASAGAFAARRVAVSFGAGDLSALAIAWAVLGSAYACTMLYAFGLRAQIVPLLSHLRPQHRHPPGAPQTAPA